jgi:uncharacterized protein YjeT (DUF2065 family)
MVALIMDKVYFGIVLLFGLFLVWSGFMMFLNPTKVKQIIAKAGSTYFINYFELGTRLVIGFAFINVVSKFGEIYKVFGYFLTISAIILMLIPIKLHNGFSVKAAEKLKPIYLKFFGPISAIVGLLVIYGLF